MTLSFLIGFTLYFDAFYNHFAFSAKEIDNPTNEIEDFDYPSAVKQKEIHAKRTLRKIIKYHIIVKE